MVTVPGDTYLQKVIVKIFMILFLIFYFTKYSLCASITHWLGSISKLPNQCENITKFSRHFQNCPINVRKLPNQCEMLAHPPCASISHWLGSSVHWLGSFQNGQKNIEIFSHWLGSFEILPNQCVMLAHIN